MQGPFRATLDDFDSLVQCADACFVQDRERGGNAARWPHCYARDADRLRHSLVMKDAGRVVAHVGYADQTARAGECRIRVAGITGVATLPEYRGRGLMTRLLNHCIQCIEEEGYPLSELGGNVQRYRRFGWEACGRAWSFVLTPRSLAEVPPPQGWTVRLYQDGGEDLARVRAIHDREPSGLVRSGELYRMLLTRSGRETLLAFGPEGEEAYAVATVDDRRSPSLAEFGGSAEGLRAIVQSLRDGGGEKIAVEAPWTHPANQTFWRLASRWSVQCLRMMRINDLAATLECFAPQLAARFAGLGLAGDRRIALAMQGTDQRAGLRFGGGGVQVDRNGDGEALALDRLEMARFLFGPGAPSHTADLTPDARFLDALFPLDFHVWSNETV